MCMYACADPGLRLSASNLGRTADRSFQSYGIRSSNANPSRTSTMHCAPEQSRLEAASAFFLCDPVMNKMTVGPRCMKYCLLSLSSYFG